jgi:SAM-dependent methyltransferase
VSLLEVKRSWEEFAQTDPLWAILTDPTKKGGRWSPAEFFASGEVEIDGVLRAGEALGLPRERGRALDFGCGVGRLTQAMCRHFDRCDGIDIAPTMIEQARRFNRFGDRCSYLQSEAPDLGRYEDGTFDFIYSRLVLQHMPPANAKRYVSEFVRTLRPGGLLVFQIPGGSVTPLALLGWWQRWSARREARRRGAPIMEMFGVHPWTVRARLVVAGAALLRVEEDGGAGPPLRSFRYWATRR